MSNPEKIIDPYQLFGILKATEGKIAPAVSILQKAGVHATAANVKAAIEENTWLKAYFGESSPVQHDLSPDQITAIVRGKSPFADANEVSTEELEDLAIQNLDEMIVAKGFAGLGFNNDEINQINSLAAVVGHGFKKTVDAAHGSTFVALMRLQARAAEITENILKNEELVTHHAKAKDGTVFTYEGPRYSDEIKLEWQKELTAIYDQIRRISEVFNNAAGLRQQAADMQLRQSELEQKAKSKKKVKKVKVKTGKGQPQQQTIEAE